MLNILIIEGNAEDILADNETRGMKQAWQAYAEAMAIHAPDARFDVAYPHASHRQKALMPFIDYDGFVQTGSGVAFSAADAEARPYIDFLGKLLATGKPVLGSCWGIQTAAVALGGMAGINPKGTEIGLARNIRLTDDGKAHTLFAGMPAQFDSPCWHRDHINRMPDGAVLLAANEVSPVQAFAYARNGVDYMGVQFHPETPLDEMKAAHDAYAEFGPMPGTILQLIDFPDIAPPEVTDPVVRTRPIGNWLKRVAAAKSRKAIREYAV